MEEIFGKGSRHEIENVTAREKIVERIEDMSKTEQQYEEWEAMRREEKKRQREDRRLNSSGGETRPSQPSLEARQRPQIL